MNWECVASSYTLGVSGFEPAAILPRPGWAVQRNNRPMRRRISQPPWRQVLPVGRTAARADALAEGAPAHWRTERKIGQQQVELDFFQQALRRVRGGQQQKDALGSAVSSRLSRKMMPPRRKARWELNRCAVWPASAGWILRALAAVGAAPGRNRLRGCHSTAVLSQSALWLSSHWCPSLVARVGR